MSQFMSADEFKKICDVSRETMDKFVCYSEMLIKWQKSINLVSNSTIEDLWRRHFYDSAQLIDYFKDANGAPQILDIGSGAGFPGLVLSILKTGRVHLVESNGKKCAFMKQVIQKTGIDAIVHNERIEKMDIFPVDFITSRACADLETLFGLSDRFLTEHVTCLFLKGERADEEIKKAQLKWTFQVRKSVSRSDDKGIILKIGKINPC